MSGKLSSTDSGKAMPTFEKKALFMISIAASLANVHPQTLRVYEKKGLLKPRRSARNTRLYSQRDIDRLGRINQLTDEGVNLAGIIKILELEEKIGRLEDKLQSSKAENDRLTESHRKEVEKVHRSYRREIAVMPRGEIQLIVTKKRRK